MSRIGDVNGDGRDDWAVGAPFANNAGAEAGRVYVYYGADPLPTEPDLVLEGPIAGIRFGWSVAADGEIYLTTVSAGPARIVASSLIDDEDVQLVSVAADTKAGADGVSEPAV